MLENQITVARDKFLGDVANCQKNGIDFGELLLGLSQIAPNDKAARLLEEAAAVKE